MSYSDKKIQDIWDKGEKVPNYDEKKWRKDVCKAWIYRDYYGKTETIYGWEADHIKTKSAGGTDATSNLRPMQWENNRSRADGNTSFCVVTSVSNENVRK